MTITPQESRAPTLSGQASSSRARPRPILFDQVGGPSGWTEPLVFCDQVKIYGLSIKLEVHLYLTRSSNQVRTHKFYSLNYEWLMDLNFFMFDWAPLCRHIFYTLDALNIVILPPLSSQHLRLPRSLPSPRLRHLSLYCILRGSLLMLHAYLRRSLYASLPILCIRLKTDQVLIHCSIPVDFVAS